MVIGHVISMKDMHFSMVVILFFSDEFCDSSGTPTECMGIDVLNITVWRQC